MAQQNLRFALVRLGVHVKAVRWLIPIFDSGYC